MQTYFCCFTHKCCFLLVRGDNPLAHYRPEGPIKFNVQRAQQAQQAMGVSLPISTPGRNVYPAATPAYPVINGYISPINGYPPESNIYQQPNHNQQDIHYTSYY